jgi:phosphonoacetate hydrolase
LICLIDGLGPDYIAASEMYTLKKLMKTGAYRVGKGAMPSLTNVNNASLATAAYPEAHGITANTFHDPELKQIVELSDPKYLRAPSLFASARQRQIKTAWVSAKEKVRLLIGHQARINTSAEREGVPMYDAANTDWVFDRGRSLLHRAEVDLLYLTTSDYMMHTYAPTAPQSLEHLSQLDRHLTKILDDHPNLELYLCADHGMNAKTVAIDPGRVLAAKGIRARAVAAIADAHKTHHNDLGGSVYVDLESPAQAEKARDILLAERGIEEVLSRAEAVKKFRLYGPRTGDLMVLGAPAVALGSLSQSRTDVKVRTHGSVHETAIPLLIHGRKTKPVASIVELTAGRPWESE